MLRSGDLVWLSTPNKTTQVMLQTTFDTIRIALENLTLFWRCL